MSTRNIFYLGPVEHKQASLTCLKQTPRIRHPCFLSYSSTVVLLELRKLLFRVHALVNTPRAHRLPNGCSCADLWTKQRGKQHTNGAAHNSVKRACKDTSFVHLTSQSETNLHFASSGCCQCFVASGTLHAALLQMCSLTSIGNCRKLFTRSQTRPIPQTILLNHVRLSGRLPLHMYLMRTYLFGIEFESGAMAVE